MPDPATSLALAWQVAETARQLGLDSALIGAAALAVHRYTRGTKDIDLAVAVDHHRELVALGKAFVSCRLHTRLRLPDDEAPLGHLTGAETLKG